MKRIIPILVFAFVGSFSFNLNAQQINNNKDEHRHHGWCGSTFDGEQLDALDAFAEYYYHRGGKEAYAASPRALKFVPISYHIVRQTDGSGMYPLSQALNDLCVLNQDMSHADIQFYLKNHPTKNTMIDLSIKNNTWNNGTGGSSSTQFTLLPSFNNDQSAVNVYQVSKIRDDGTVAGIASGSVFHTPSPGAPNAQSSCILIKKGAGDNDQTLAHEFGHNFSMPHTFYEWEGDPPFSNGYDYNGTNNSGCGAIAPNWAEKYSSLNCSTSGDRFCDTSPDYERDGFSCTTNNPQFSTCLQMDADSVTGFADGGNIMSYGFNCTNRAFSTDQINMMDHHLTTYRSGLIANTPTVTAISANATLDPADASIYDAVNLSWSAVPNATHYAIEIALTPGFSSTVMVEMAVTSTNSYTAIDLLANKTYRWRVIPFNATYLCSSPSAIETFTTSNFATGTHEIAEVNQMSIRPNFTTSGQSVNLFVDATQSFDADINIYNVQGQLVTQEKQRTFQSGSTVYPINTAKLTAGMYIVAVQTENGIMKEKLVITK